MQYESILIGKGIIKEVTPCLKLRQTKLRLQQRL